MTDLMASDAGRWTLIAAFALLFAIYGWLADRQRMRRRNPDRVGWVPWTGLFLLALLVAAVAGGLAVRIWLAPV